MPKRELSWKWRLPIAIIAIAAALLVGRMMVRGTELPIPHKRHHADRQIRLAPVVTLPDRGKPAPTIVDRPAGMP